MTKTERIEQLEAKVKELEERIALLEARSGTWWYLPPQRSTYFITPPWTTDNTRCTCGTTAVCPIHDMHPLA